MGNGGGGGVSIETEMREDMETAIRTLEPGMVFRAKAMRRYADILIACGITDEVVIRSALQMWMSAQNQREDQVMQTEAHLKVLEAQQRPDAIARYWVEHYRAPDGICKLCADTGLVITTRGWAGRCICATGREVSK